MDQGCPGAIAVSQQFEHAILTLSRAYGLLESSEDISDR